MLTMGEITEKFNQLIKLGVCKKVYHLNSNRRMPTGSIGMSDHIIPTKNYLILIEDKRKNERVSERQNEFRDAMQTLEKIEGSRIKYFFNDSADRTEEIFQTILEELR